MKATDDRKDLDYQFNPTEWTPRIGSEDFIAAHVAFAEAQSKVYRAKLEESEIYSIPYDSSGSHQEIDVFRPKRVQSGAPIVVYIHGGWWQWFSKDMFSFMAQPFNRAGLAVYMPAYTLAQDWNMAEPMTRIVEQLEQAILKVFEEAETHEASQIILVGHSAGGQLVSLLHRTDWQGKYAVPKEAADKLSAVFSLAGLFDLRPLTNCYVNDAIGMTKDEAERLSPACLPLDEARLYPAMHLVLPEHDTAEFYRQTKEYQQQLLSQGQSCHLRVLPEKDHVSMIESVLNEEDELMAYILRSIRLPQPLNSASAS